MLNGGKLRILILVLALGGCAFRGPAVRMAVDHNDFVAQTTNQQTVLNILRASYREPMHFTSFSQVRGTVDVNAGAGLDYTNPPNSNGTEITEEMPGVDQPISKITEKVTGSLVGNTWKPNLSVGVSTGTSFDIVINADEAFYRGIMSPLSPETVVFYLRQGIDGELLSHLMIGSIRFYADISCIVDETTGGCVYDTPKPGEKPKTFNQIIELTKLTNAPDEEDYFKAFKDALACRVVDYELVKKQVTGLPISNLSQLSNIDKTVLDKVDYADTNPMVPALKYSKKNDKAFELTLSAPRREDMCELQRSTLENKFEVLLDPEDQAHSNHNFGQPHKIFKKTKSRSERSPNRYKFSTSPTRQTDLREGKEGRSASFEEDSFFNHLIDTNFYKATLVVDVNFRSVEGILYYLGEYIRVKGQEDRTERYIQATENGSPLAVPILRVVETKDLENMQPFVSVTYRDKEYSVPLSGQRLTSQSGRSSQVIAIVQQLLNLHRSSKALPTTGLVRLAN